MPDRARPHQSKQGPCRLRGSRGHPLISLIVESVACGILSPAAIAVLDRNQPACRLAHHRIAMLDSLGIVRTQHRPGTVDVIQAPAAVPRPLGELSPAQIVDTR